MDQVQDDKSSLALLDSDTKRLLELTTNDDRRTEEDAENSIDEIINIIKCKAPKLLDGLTENNKKQIAISCQVKLYAYDDVVFHQGDPPDAYYTNVARKEVFLDSRELLFVSSQVYAVQYSNRERPVT